MMGTFCDEWSAYTPHLICEMNVIHISIDSTEPYGFPAEPFSPTPFFEPHQKYHLSAVNILFAFTRNFF